MKLKTARFLSLFIFLFVFAANFSLEARHHHRRTTTYVTNTYVAPAPQPVYVVQEHYRQPVVYAPLQTVVYQQPIYQQPVYQERVIIRERQSPANFFTSFALGLGFGLLIN